MPWAVRFPVRAARPDHVGIRAEGATAGFAQMGMLNAIDRRQAPPVVKTTGTVHSNRG
jgi:hypothetical protein